MNAQQRGRLALGAVVAFMVTLSARPAAPWNGSGHRLIALVAWEGLSAEERTRVVDALEHHFRFDEDFKGEMPSRIAEGPRDARDRWVFLHASTWPDIARGFDGDLRAEHHRATWHYINEPLYLNEETREGCFRDSVPANFERDWEPGLAASEMNAVQALEKCKAMLSDAETDAADRALYLCWLFHLVGDLHQPLHSTALFTCKRFPLGDRGGNSIPTLQRSNLHAFWDGALGSDRSVSALSSTVAGWLADPDLVSSGERARASLDFGDWTDESYKAAWEFVYDEAILDEVASKEADLGEGLARIDLSQTYIETAAEVSIRRAVQAGYRLGELLKNP